MSRTFVVFAGLVAMLMGLNAVFCGIMNIIQEGGFNAIYHQNHGTQEIVLSIATATAGLLSLGFSFFLFHFSKTAEKPRCGG